MNKHTMDISHLRIVDVRKPRVGDIVARNANSLGSPYFIVGRGLQGLVVVWWNDMEGEPSWVDAWDPRQEWDILYER